MVSPIPGSDPNSVEIDVRITANQGALNRAKALLADFKKTLHGSVVPDNPRIQQAFKDYEAAARKAREETQKNVDVTDRWVNKVAQLRRQSELDKLSRALSKATSDGQKLEKTLAQVNARLREIGASEDEIEGVLASAGSRTSIGGSRGAALQALGREARLSLPSFPIPGTPFSTDFIGRFAEVAGRLGLTFKDLAISGGLAAVAVAGIALAIDNFQKTLKPIEDLIRGITAAQLEVAGLLASNDPAAIVSRFEEATRELTRLEAERAKGLEQQAIEAQSLAAQQAPDFLRTLIGGVMAESLTDILSKGPFEEATAAIVDYNTKIAAQELILGELNKTLTDARVGVLQKEYNDQLKKAGPIFEQLRQQYQDTIDSFTESNRQRAEDARLAGQFQAEDRALEDAARAASHQDTLAKIEDDGNQRIEDLAAASKDRIADRFDRLNEQLADIASGAGDKIADVNDDFRADELKRGREFRKDEARDIAEFRKEEKRRREDNAQELLDAEIANDAAAFIQAQQKQRTEGRREQEDFNEARSQRQADFDDERRERQQAKEERIADIRVETEERSRAAIVSFEKERAAQEAKTAEAIALETAAIATRTQAAIDSYNAEVEGVLAARERADH